MIQIRAGTNEHFLHSNVLLLKQTNVRIVCFTWFVHLIIENSLEIKSYIMTLSLLILHNE